jgi:hypothetical protein
VSVTPFRGSNRTVRAILRVVVTVVLSALALVLLYLVREPLGWIVMREAAAVEAPP